MYGFFLKINSIIVSKHSWSIYILVEIRQRGRFAGFSLYVSNTDVSTTSDIKSSALCYKNEYQLPPLNFSTICTKFGRYVIFYNERLDSVTYPDGYQTNNVITELCEVIVQGKYIITRRNYVVDNPLQH